MNKQNILFNSGKTQKIINIAICSSGRVTSGGERCLIELMRQFNNLGLDQEVLLGYKESAIDICSKRNIRCHFLLKKSFNMKNKISTLFSYFLVFAKSIFLLRRYFEKIIIISHSDAWPDVLFSNLLKDLILQGIGSRLTICYCQKGI